MCTFKRIIREGRGRMYNKPLCEYSGSEGATEVYKGNGRRSDENRELHMLIFRKALAQLHIYTLGFIACMSQCCHPKRYLAHLLRYELLIICPLGALPNINRISASIAVYGCYVRSEVFMAVTMKNAVFWVLMPYGSSRYRRFGGTYRLHHQGEKNYRAWNNVRSN
jgi:hypothetical protein